MLKIQTTAESSSRGDSHHLVLSIAIILVHAGILAYVLIFSRVPTISEERPYSITDYALQPGVTELRVHRGRLFSGLALTVLSACVSLVLLHRKKSPVREFDRKLVPEIAEGLTGSPGSIIEVLCAAIDEASDSIVITDKHGLIQYVNSAFVNASGYERGELIGQHARILKSGEHDPDFYARFSDVISSGKVWKGKVINRRKDGSFCHEHMVVRPVACEAEGILKYVAVKEDLTSQIAMEERLRQSQKMQTIGELSGGIAHDFNNLLTVVLGNCNLLIYGVEELGAFAKENIEEIMSAAERASSLTRRLLAFSRKQTHQPEIIDLNDLITGLKKMLRRLIPENINIVIRVAEHPIYVKADPVMLEQAVINLSVNARDAMPQGGELTVAVNRTANEEHPDLPALVPGYYAELTVQDTGEGMDDATKSHIFERFFTTKPAGGGTGIGLATVQEIVQQERGAITVDSALGVGAVFTIYLPLLQGVKQDTVHETLPAEGPRLLQQPVVSTPRTGTQETILVVDDEASVLRMIERALSNRGYRVCSAMTEDQLLGIWARDKSDIDLLLTDVVMPGRSGVELAALLRKDRPDLRVLCMSAYTDSVITGLGGTPTGMRFLQKPFTPDVLAKAVREALTGIVGDDQVTSEL